MMRTFSPIPPIVHLSLTPYSFDLLLKREKLDLDHLILTSFSETLHTILTNYDLEKRKNFFLLFIVNL